MKTTLFLSTAALGFVLAGCNHTSSSSTDAGQAAATSPIAPVVVTASPIAPNQTAEASASNATAQDPTSQTSESSISSNRYSAANSGTGTSSSSAPDRAGVVNSSGKLVDPQIASTQPGSTTAGRTYDSDSAATARREASSGATNPSYSTRTTSTASRAISTAGEPAISGSSSSLGLGHSDTSDTLAVRSETIENRITEWKLSAADIRADLDTSGKIVRTKEVGAGAPTGGMDNLVVMSMVKGKLKTDQQLAALDLEVRANSNTVALAGTARSAGQVGRAIAHALNTEGVTQVTSTIKVDSP